MSPALARVIDVDMPLCPREGATLNEYGRKVVSGSSGVQAALTTSGLSKVGGDVARSTAISNDSTSNRQGKSRRLDQTA